MDNTADGLRVKSQADAGAPARAKLEATFRSFFDAYAVRDAGRVAPFLHENIEWTVSGPVDVLPFCGVHRGRENVVDLIGRQVPAVLRVFNFVPDSTVIDGDRVAMLCRLSARRASDGHVISYRVANFFRFVDSQVIENLSLLDSFDAVEQVIGRPLMAQDGIVPAMSDLVSL